MTVGVPREHFPGERRVALVPAHVSSLAKAELKVIVEKGAGEASGFLDGAYEDKGAGIVDDVYPKSDVVLTVRAAAAAGDADLPAFREGQTVLGYLEPYGPHPAFAKLVEQKVTSLSMELIPRITRAQSMDALSSMANLAGYRAAILVAEALPKMFPMMMTAAGTIVPAKIFIIGVGVAGLQAIATTRRLGAVVGAYDVRPAVREQVESLGARFIEMELQTDDAEGSGGYAKAMDEEFYRKQREFMTTVIADSDAVITTAAIPGKPSPVLVTEVMVKQMAPGSVIVDLAAERGGNCELTEAGKTVQKYGVTILGPENIPSALAFNASQLYSKNITTFLLSLISDGRLKLDIEDEIVAATLVTREGTVPNVDLKERLGL
ncbi:MAG: Re/Si-specific NAD(P)(+) transhydrogenase subunit alpha [Spirochaetia bacterium]